MKTSPSSDIKPAAPCAVQLGAVQETMMIPLWARAVETGRRDGLFRDPYAERIVESLDYDFSRFRAAWRTQLDIAIRTLLLDQVVAGFVQRHADGLIVNLAAGLDARMWRLDNGRLMSLDVDLPDAMELRRQFFTEDERHRMLAGSALEPDWIDVAGATGRGALLIVAEGLFPYFTEAQVRGLLRMIADRLPGSEIVYYSCNRWLAANHHRHDAVNRTPARFEWGGQFGREVVQWDDRLQLVDEWYHIDYCRRRWGLQGLAAMLPVAKRFFRDLMKTTHLRVRK